MDLINDIKSAAIGALDYWKIDYSKASDWDSIVLLFFNKKLMFISNSPRDVKVSHKIKSSTYDAVTENALASIENKFRKGEDVNPHSSRLLYNGTFTDPLFADWYIRHFHLNTDPDLDDPRLVKRSGDVLFLTVTGDTAYFIDVRSHGKNHPNAFVQKDLLEMVVDEWPGLFIELPGVIGVGKQIETPEEIKFLRKNKINATYMCKGKVYFSPGGGVTNAGKLMKAARLKNALYYWRRNLEKCVNNNRPQIDEFLSQFENYNPEEASFRVGMYEGEFVFYEETSMAGMSMFGGDQEARFVWESS